MPILVPTTWNPMDKGSSVALYDSNTTASSNHSGSVRSVFGASSGKWYFEVKSIADSGLLGIGTASARTSSPPAYPGADAFGRSLYFMSGGIYVNNAATAYASPIPVGTVVGVRLDMDAGTLSFSIGGVDKGIAFSGLVGHFFAMFGGGGSGSADKLAANFGASPFVYPVPSGFNAGFGELTFSHKVAGVTIGDDGMPAPRRVRVYRRSTGELLAAGTSDSSGLFDLVVGTLDEVYVVALDDESGTAYNALIFDRIEPIPE